LNWAAKDRLPVLFHIQDNRYAISVHRNEQTAGGTIYKILQGYEGLARCLVDGTDFFQTYSAAKAAAERLRTGAGPVCFVSEVVRLLPHSSSDSDVKYRTPEEIEADKTMDPILRMEDRLLEAGILTEALRDELYADVKEEIDEAAVWAYEQADPDPESVATNVFFDGTLDLEFESSAPDGDEIVMVDAINHALHEEMERDERVIVYGEDVAGGKGGVFTATRDLTARFGRDRCFNSPLAEDAILGTAVGLSTGGFKPVVEIQFGDYIWPGMQQLRNVISSYRYRSDGRWTCPMVIRVPIGGYIHGGPYHSQNIEAIFGHTPGLLIAIPSTASDAKGLLKTSIRSQDPILFLEHKWLYRQPVARSPEPDSDYLLPFGKARIVHEGSDLTIITYGATVYKSLDAIRKLEQEGTSVEIIDLRTIIPLDMETVLQSVRKTHRALVVHEAHTFGGFGAEVAAQISDFVFEELDAPVRRVGGTFTPIPMADPLEKAALPGEKDVLVAARSLLEY
jgi:2-oxoisovalerate dehydrogenase E1 component